MFLCFTDALGATSKELGGPDVMMSLCFTDVLGATSQELEGSRCDDVFVFYRCPWCHQ